MYILRMQKRDYRLLAHAAFLVRYKLERRPTGVALWVCEVACDMDCDVKILTDSYPEKPGGST